MYRPTAFMVEDHRVGLQVIGQFPLAQLVIIDETGAPMATPVPLLADRDGTRLVGHLARNNPVATSTSPRDALVIFSGANAYVSPSYYPSKHDNPSVVPTWNYSTVQVRGVLVVHDDPTWTEWVVRLLTAEFESESTNPWQVDDAPHDYIAKMVGAIVGIEIGIVDMAVKLKLSQNRSESDRLGVTLRFDEGSPEQQAVAAAMRQRINPAAW